MSEKSKAALARILGISRASLYYVSKKEKADWELKTRIETVLREHPAYGSRRLAIALSMNRKKVKRVMNKFGLKPYRRRVRKWRKTKKIEVLYANLLFTIIPSYPHHVWAADFTELSFRGRTIYVATVIDLYTREIVGVAVSIRKGVQLTIQALYHALLNHQRPTISHSDNGTDYDAKVYTATLTDVGSLVSRSHPSCPWENGYQESFYDKFKVDLGDPNRFATLGELVAEVYRTIWTYNNTRIHSALKMPPREFARRQKERTIDMG